jgi:hypothetical protein
MIAKNATVIATILAIEKISGLVQSMKVIAGSSIADRGLLIAD